LSLRRGFASLLTLSQKRNTLRLVTGFTMVEALVVVTILSVCAGGIISVFFSGIKLWNRAVNVDFDRTDFFLGMEQLSRDLRQSVYIPSVGFQGNATEMSFCAFERDSVVKITYLFDVQRSTLVRRTVSLKDARAAEEKQPYTEKKVLPLAQVFFTYFFYDKAKEKGGWKDAWKKEEGVCPGVRLEGRYKGEGFYRKIFIPVS
jgi:hypothetical protein